MDNCLFVQKKDILYDLFGFLSKEFSDNVAHNDDHLFISRCPS